MSQIWIFYITRFGSLTITCIRQLRKGGMSSEFISPSWLYSSVSKLHQSPPIETKGFHIATKIQYSLVPSFWEDTSIEYRYYIYLYHGNTGRMRDTGAAEINCPSFLLFWFIWFSLDINFCKNEPKFRDESSRKNEWRGFKTIYRLWTDAKSLHLL